MANVRLSHLADADLDAIRNYIELHNPQAANQVLDQVFDVLEQLAGEPGLGERRDDLCQSLRAFVVRPYVIFYYAASDGIHVARIIHGARDFAAMFRASE